MELWQAAVQLGLTGALVIFFVMEGKSREKRLSDRLTQVEDFQRNELFKLAASAIDAVKENTLVLRQFRRFVKSQKGSSDEPAESTNDAH